jgi:hypothetical protein
MARMTVDKILEKLSFALENSAWGQGAAPLLAVKYSDGTFGPLQPHQWTTEEIEYFRRWLMFGHCPRCGQFVQWRHFQHGNAVCYLPAIHRAYGDWCS